MNLVKISNDELTEGDQWIAYLHEGYVYIAALDMPKGTYIFQVNCRSQREAQAIIEQLVAYGIPPGKVSEA